MLKFQFLTQISNFWRTKIKKQIPIVVQQRVPVWTILRVYIMKWEKVHLENGQLLTDGQNGMDS